MVSSRFSTWQSLSHRPFHSLAGLSALDETIQNLPATNRITKQGSLHQCSRGGTESQTQILWTRGTHATFYPTEFSPAFNIPAPSPGISNLILRTVITITETNFPERERLALLGRGFSSEAFFSLAQNRVGGHLQIDFLTQSTNVFLYFVPIKIPEICQCHLLPHLWVIIQRRSHCTELPIG